MKRIIAALLIAILTLTMAGCSNEELGIYSLMKEIMLLDVTETSGTASISMQGQFIDGITKNAPKELSFIKKLFDPGMEMRYSLKQNKKTSEYEARLDFRFKGEGEFKKLTTIMGNKKVIYVKLDDVFIFLKPYITATEPETEKFIDQITAKIEYLEVDLEKGSYKGIYKKGYSGTAQEEKAVKVVIGFLDIFKEAFRGFSSGVVTKKANGYEITLGIKDLKPLIIKFMEYFSENIDDIVDITGQKINALSEDEFNVLKEVTADPLLTRAKILAELEKLRARVKKTFPDEIKELKTDATFDATVLSLEGTSYKYSLGKLDNGSYELSSNLKIRFEKMLTLDYVEEAITRKAEAFSVQKPANTVNEEQYKSIIDSIVPPSVKEVRININNGNTKVILTNSKSENRKLEITQKDGFTYLSLQSFNGTFNENAYWDSTAKEAVIEKQGRKLYLAGLSMGGKNYIKVKELSKLGYYVRWDKRTNETVISKPYKRSIFN